MEVRLVFSFRCSLGAFIFALACGACGANDQRADLGLMADGGPLPSPATDDAGAPLDAGASTDSGPWVPSVKAAPPPACFDLDTCRTEEVAFSLVGETPANIELRQAVTNGILAYDSDAKGFLYYSVEMANMASDRVALSERMRFDPRYDRVELDSSQHALVCQAASCEFIVGFGEPPNMLHVPDAVLATVIDRTCVAGDGIACVNDAGTAWTWALGPGVLERPIRAFARLGGAAFVASDEGGKVFIVDGGKIMPLEVRTSEPIVTISASFQYQWWAGRSSAGELVFGSYGSAHVCSGRVDSVAASSDFLAQQGDAFVHGFTQCGRAAVPPAMSGVGVSLCGISSIPFAFDAHHVYAPPAQCMLD